MRGMFVLAAHRAAALSDKRSRRAMSRDTQMYDSPDDFIPERFLKQGLDGMQVTDPERYQFGFGRR